jgi:hypothetical protein
VSLVAEGFWAGKHGQMEEMGRTVTVTGAKARGDDGRPGHAGQPPRPGVFAPPPGYGKPDLDDAGPQKQVVDVPVEAFGVVE